MGCIFGLDERDMSVALIKGNARMFERSVCAVREQYGQRYVEGFAVLKVPDAVVPVRADKTLSNGY